MNASYHSFLMDNYYERNNLIKRAVLTYVSLKQNSNKYYLIELEEMKRGEFYIYQVIRKFGRIGISVRIEKTTYLDEEEALRGFQSIYCSKTARGYTDVEEGYDFISLYWQDIYHDRNIERFPLIPISSSQIEKAYQILEKLEELLIQDVNDIYLIEKYSNQYYRAIPTAFGRTIHYKESLIDTFEKINQKRTFLNSLLHSIESKNNYLFF